MTTTVVWCGSQHDRVLIGRFLGRIIASWGDATMSIPLLTRCSLQVSHRDPSATAKPGPVTFVGARPLPWVSTEVSKELQVARRVVHRTYERSSDTSSGTS
jgi:hypothetical protein